MIHFMKNLFLTLFLFSSSIAFGQAKLERLVSERDQLLLEWESSEVQRTGFFGNRTKKDMAETNEWLERIVKQDNLILDELRLRFSIDSSLIAQEKEDYKAITLGLERNIQSLQRAVEDRDAQLMIKKSERKIYELIFIFLLSGLMVLGYWIFKTKEKNSLSGV
jgi:hypothetical protein